MICIYCNNIGRALISLDRTSATVWIDRSDSKIIDNVVKRIADVIKIDEKKLFLNASAESSDIYCRR